MIVVVDVIIDGDGDGDVGGKTPAATWASYGSEDSPIHRHILVNLVTLLSSSSTGANFDADRVFGGLPGHFVQAKA